MKTKLTIARDNLSPPKRSEELATFSQMLQHMSARTILEKFGITLPDTFELIEHTNPDDPPDFLSLGFGFEVTEFPPNQSAREAIWKQKGWSGGRIPTFQDAGKTYTGILREIDDPKSKRNDPYHFATQEGEIEALKKEFLSLLEGPRSKDVHGNDILLLDHRREPISGCSLEAIKRATLQKHPTHLKLIIMVSADESIQAFPRN